MQQVRASDAAALRAIISKGLDAFGITKVDENTVIGEKTKP